VIDLFKEYKYNFLKVKLNFSLFCYNVTNSLATFDNIRCGELTVEYGDY